MSRRKQSNPKPIKHDDDDRDEMDSCTPSTPVNGYPLVNDEQEDRSSRLPWDSSQLRHNSLDKLSDNIKDYQVNGTDASTELAHEGERKSESSFTQFSMGRTSKSIRVKNDESINKTDDKTISADDNDDAISTSALNVNQINLKSMTAMTKCTSNEDGNLESRIENQCESRITDSDNVRDEERLCQRENQISRTGSSSDSCHTDQPLDSRVLSATSAPHASSTSESPNNSKKSDIIRVKSQHLQLGNEVVQNIFEDSEEEGTPKPSFMARFPIIPNGKGPANSSRLSSQHKLPIEDSNRIKPKILNISDISSSETDTESCDNSTISVNKTKRSNLPRPSSLVSPSNITSKVDANLTRCQEEAELALVNQLQLPSDVLYLRQQEVIIHGTPNLGWVVCCAIPLPQNSSLGPFQGQLVAPEDVKVGDLIIQFTNKRGQQALMNVAGQTGGWLALLRTPHTPAQRNTHVYWEGGRIWCEIISDIDMGTELRATFSFQHDEEEEGEEVGEEVELQEEPRTESLEQKLEVSSPSTGDPSDSTDPMKVKVEPPSLNCTNSNDVSDASKTSIPQPQPHQLPPHPNQQQPSPGHAALIYGCPFCGVRFSSPRTLQGHLSFYCSKKSSESSLYTPAGGGTAVKHARGGSQAKNETCAINQEPGERSPEERGTKRRASDTEGSNDTHAQLSPSKSACKISAARISRSSPSRTSDSHTEAEDTYECDRCTYSTDRVSSMNNHKRMHAIEDVAKSSASNNNQVTNASALLRDSERHRPGSILKLPSSETFCKECKIQFSSMRTFKCHKENYCAQRRKKSMAEPSPFSAMFNSPFPFPTNSARTSVNLPSALQMSALSQRGLILPGKENEMTAAAAAAAMILQANLAAMSLPGMIMHQRDMGSASDLLSQHRVSLTGSSQEPNRDSSPKLRHSLHSDLLKMEPMAGTEHSSNGLPPVSLRNRSGTSKPASPSESPKEKLKGVSEAESSSSHSLQQEDKTFKTNVKQNTLNRKESREEDHPLDLSVTKPQGNQARKRSSVSPERGHSPEKRLISHQISPPRVGSSESPSTPPVNQPILSPLKREVQDRESLNSIGSLRKNIISSEALHSHLIAQSDNPSLLLRHSGFLAIPSSSSGSDRGLNVYPPIKRWRSDSPIAVARSISKCLDCNIVFYKHDNYLVHKQYYCSGKRRPRPPSSRSVSPISPTLHSIKSAPLSPHKVSLPSHSPHRNIETSPTLSLGPIKVSSPQLQRNSNSPTREQLAGKAKYKFYCVPCRIKFSNASILEAHKEYYCPAGKDSEQSVILQTATSSSHDSSSQVSSLLSPHEDGEGLIEGSPEPQHEEVTCNRCNSVFTSARLLRLHVCEGGFPCPHCDHVAITENRLAEHLKVHAPTRAYRCTICGYRGNTARGMRMHGKTHIDEGVNFTDENMLEYEEPAVMPIISHASTSGLSGSAATDSELLRLKNEPYKRRRSRKAYEKFDYPLPKVDIPQTCPLCGQNFANADFLASHFKVHQIAASQYLAGLMKCIHCSYVGKSPEDLRAHFESNHASNHRIHFSRRVSPAETAEEEPSEDLIIENDIDTNSLEDDKEGLCERLCPFEPKKLMVLRDPNSPVNDKNPKSKTEITEDYKDASHSPSPFPVEIKEEPMEHQEALTSQDGPVEHFLHLPASFSANISGNRQSPPVRKLSVSPSVFLHRNKSPARSNQAEQERCEPSTTVATQDYPPSIMIKTEPTEIIDSEMVSQISPRSIQEKACDSSCTIAVTSPYVSFAGASIRMKSGAIEDTYDSNHKREELTETMSNSSPVRLISSPVSLITQVKKEIQGTDEQITNFLSFPGSQHNTRPISHEASPSSPALPTHRLEQSLHNKPLPPCTERTISPSTTHHRNSPTQSSSMVSSIVPSAPLTSPFPPHGIVPHHSLPFPYSNPQALPFFFLPGQARFNNPRQQLLVNSREDRESRYCQNCDISFSKQATYLAHKKYYCTARPRGEPQPSATA